MQHFRADRWSALGKGEPTALPHATSHDGREGDPMVSSTSGSELNSHARAIELQTSAGHLIRRCQQIAVAIFLAEFEGTGLTPVQYSALATIAAHPGLDQSALVNRIAVDRSTIGAILRSLEERDLVRRITPPHNQRVKQLFVRPRGETLLRETPALGQRTQDRILAPLSSKERTVFMTLLARLVDDNNEFSRAPLRMKRTEKTDAEI